jgi:hypothetical protein
MCIVCQIDKEDEHSRACDLDVGTNNQAKQEEWVLAFSSALPFLGENQPTR